VPKELTDFSLIDKSLTVDGTIHCKGKLIVNGTLKGKIFGENVIIAEGGTVCADIIATSVSVGGKFEGSIRKTKEVVILSTGVCSGSIQCDSLVLDPGGTLNAEVECLKKDTNEY
jgi:cytoskeletal protein CcmA (bactofilin family)